jgi:hypothetical protein
VKLGWLLVATFACTGRNPTRELDLDQIKVAADNARLRTDTVGLEKWEETSAFVLVDAENTASEAAYVTLGGELTDATGTAVGKLKRQSLYVPAHASRTFALVDTERQPRPTATSARIVVTGAQVAAEPPHVRVEDLHTYVDENRIVAQANLVNDVDKMGQVIVIASFHDAQGRPTKRPFQLLRIGATSLGTKSGDCFEVGSHDWPTSSKCPVQFVGPTGSKDATIYVGEIVY